METNPELKYKKAERSIPLSPRKKSRRHQQPCQEIQIKDSSGKKQGRKEKERIESGEKRVAREPFEKSTYITYTTPGRGDTVYVRMYHGRRQYKQKRYLLWKIRDFLGIINASKVITNEQYTSFHEKFQRDLSFRQLNEFLKAHKEHGMIKYHNLLACTNVMKTQHF